MKTSSAAAWGLSSFHYCGSIWTLESKAHVLFLKAPDVVLVPTQTDESDENDRGGSKENVPSQKEKERKRKEKKLQLVYTYTMRLTKATFCSSWLKVIFKHSIR